MAHWRMFVGGYTGQEPAGSLTARGISVFDMDAKSGALREVAVTRGILNPSFLAFDPTKRFLFAVNETSEFNDRKSGSVSAFYIEKDGRLRLLNQKESHGTDPCYVAVDKAGGNVLVANYSSGSVAVLPVNADGSLRDASCVMQHSGSSVNPMRQAGPHAHAAVFSPDNRFVLVPELGGDTVQIYRFDGVGGRLTANENQPAFNLPPGAGPRQIVMHPGGALAFLINELNSTMTACAYDANRGTLIEINSLSTLPAIGFSGPTTCAEVQVSPDGRFLYGSNRGHNSLVIYAISERDGSISLVGHEDTRGRTPRVFEISPDGAFICVANQDDGNLVVFRRDAVTGLLDFTGHEVGDVGMPVCVRFI